MNLTIDRSILLSALTKLSGVVARRETIPILSHVLIEASGPTITLRVTNGDLEATVTTQANIKGPGMACVSAEKLTAIVKNAAEGAEISLTLKDKLEIKSGRSNFKLPTLPAADFPTFAEFEAVESYVITGADIRSTIGRVAFARSNDATRYIISGVHLYSVEGVAGAVATNANRLALSEELSEAAPFAVTVPAPMIDEMLKLDGEITVKIGSKIQAATSDTVITSKLLDGQFPNYRRLIPTSFDRLMTGDCEALMLAVRRASLAADDGARSVQFKITPETLTVQARGRDGEAASDEVECAFDGGDYSFGVNSQYMLEALRAITTANVEFAFPPSTDAVPKPAFVIRSTAADGFINMVAPIGIA